MPTPLERSPLHSVSLTDTNKAQTLYSKALHIHTSAPINALTEYMHIIFIIWFIQSNSRLKVGVLTF